MMKCIRTLFCAPIATAVLSPTDVNSKTREVDASGSEPTCALQRRVTTKAVLALVLAFLPSLCSLPLGHAFSEVVALFDRNQHIVPVEPVSREDVSQQ